MLLALKGRMLRYLPLAAGALAGALLARERRARRAVERFGAASLETLLAAIEVNNPTTGKHVRRVAEYSLILADAAGLDWPACRSVERVALFHDVGKIDGALTDIVNDTASLTPGERKAVMTHTARGAEVLKPLALFYPDLGPGVLSHHERWDGTGYPRGLAGARIPLAARIVAIADTFDAMTHSRSYSHARSIDSAATVIAQGRGTQFDPDLVDLFLSPPVMEEIEQAIRASRAPHRPKRKRRSPARRARAPDIKFRWRQPDREPQPADR